MKRLVRHVLYPAAMPAAFFLVATAPVQVLGCRTRGLIALSLSLASGVAALAAVILGLRGRMRGGAGAPWWILSALVLAVPVVAMLYMA